jgi:uncharacterized protein
MHIQLDTSGPRTNLIRSYAPGLVLVNDTRYLASLVVLPERILPDWPPQAFEALAVEHFDLLAGLELEVLLLGTGRRLRFPPPELLAPLTRAGIGCEVMDTGAACRTYNILMSEGRRVAAALLMIETG